MTPTQHDAGTHPQGGKYVDIQQDWFSVDRAKTGQQ